MAGSSSSCVTPPTGKAVSVSEMFPDPLAVQAVAAVGALLGAALLTFIERRLPELQEACIGLLFVLAALEFAQARLAASILPPW